MAVAATHLLTESSGTGSTSYTTSSISPTANRLVLVAVRANNLGSITTPTLTGASMTWVEVGHVAFATDQANFTVFRGLSATPGTGALTIDFGLATIQQAHWSIVEFSGVDLSGTNGSGAVVQFATSFIDGTSNTGITVTLGAFASTNNATYGGVGNSGTANITSGTGFSELAEDNNNSRTIQTQWKATNDTSVDWTAASNTDFWGALAIEIAAAAGNTVGSRSLLGVGL